MVDVVITDRVPPLAFWRFHIRPGAWTLVENGVESFPFANVLIRSGNGRYMNDPSAIAIKDHGPIPVAWYDLGFPVDHPHTFGHYGIPMSPWPDSEMFGRSAFFFHGANPLDPLHSSNGCPYTPVGAISIRVHVHESGINVTQVVAE